MKRQTIIRKKTYLKTENIDIFKNSLSGSSEILNEVQQSLLTDHFDNECIDEAVDVLVNTLENCASSFRKDLYIQQRDTKNILT